jgi:hypothetical protein
MLSTGSSPGRDLGKRWRRWGTSTRTDMGVSTKKKRQGCWIETRFGLDFAVGAPYDGKGAVYIYHGSAKGVRKKYSQVILAEDIVPQPSRAPQTFGFSLTGGLDLDGNQYPDMAVGAYLSNKAFFFR